MTSKGVAVIGCYLDWIRSNKEGNVGNPRRALGNVGEPLVKNQGTLWEPREAKGNLS